MNTPDAIMLLVWLLLSVFNRDAAIMAACLLGYHVALYFVQDAIFFNALISTAFFTLATINISLKSYFRTAFLAFGVLYWFAAADDFAWSFSSLQTPYRDALPWFISAVNLYVIAHIAGGIARDRRHSYFNSAVRRLQFNKTNRADYHQ